MLAGHLWQRIKIRTQEKEAGQRGPHACFICYSYFSSLCLMGIRPEGIKIRTRGKGNKKILFFQLIMPLALCNPPVPGLQKARGLHKARGLSRKNLQEPCL